MVIRLLTDADRTTVKEFFKTQWGSPQMVISTGVYHCDELDGLAVFGENGEIIGLLTYVKRGEEWEIISLDSVIENKGIGSLLLQAFEKKVKADGGTIIKLVTTNDNLRALQFYQKRGYIIDGIVVNAVEKARIIKPQIPFVADNGIPIRDEIILKKKL
ncbi:GNAT family N-acetyltransferase [Bacillus alveayuensis]|jgi:GNAT superfamily N-acetyltransferase|uniref:GNAT family N-acetyltransferase n=1 Tax=Aeribacillus alveayuensis TaxID=279215 RepID=UPI0005D10BE2|nr:GNAT family N-acetyltransferase [Bacillus alveayuensis]